MGHPTTKEIELGDSDHANRISILRKEYRISLGNGRARAHRRVDGVAQRAGMSKKTIFVKGAGAVAEALSLCLWKRAASLSVNSMGKSTLNRTEA